MSTQNRNSSSRNQKKSNSGGGGGGGDSNTQASIKKTDAPKTEKQEKVHPKPTAEQLRIAQITNACNALEDPQMREKVATLIEMTQRSEEEVCCALYECDNHLERAVVFLLETLPVGAFETSSKKKKNKAATAAQDSAGGDGGEWTDANANTDKREKSRNRSSNRGGRGGTDSRGWRGREARENERNLQDSRGVGGGGGDRGAERSNDNYRSGSRGGRGGSGRGGGYVGRGGRGGGRMGSGRGLGGGRSDRGDRGGYSSRQNANDDHQEVELWDNTIAQNAEKQQQQTSDDAWGDWDNEEYVGSLKDSKVFTTSNLNQTAASVVSGGVSELSAPPGLEHHLGTSVVATPSQQGSHLSPLVGSGGGVDVDNSSIPTVAATTTMMQYSSAVSNSQLQPQSNVTPAGSISATSLNAAQYGSAADTFSSAASAAANLVQQVQQQQQQPQLKSSATLSAEQSQYFNSLTSQNNAAAAAAAAAAANAQLQQQQNVVAAAGVNTYASQTAGVQYPTSYANVFGSAASTTANVVAGDQSQLNVGQQPQVRRARAKLPPPSKIPATAVEMPGDTLNNIGYIDVQFGGLDFGTDDTFDALPEKFNAAVTIDQQQLVQSQQDVGNDYQTKNSVAQQQQQQQAAAAAALTAGLQNSQISDSLSTGFVQRGSSAAVQQQVVSNVSGGNTGSVGTNALDQLTKNDPYNQSNTGTTGYQSSYQTNASAANKAANAYQQSTAGQGYQSASYANVQSSVANTYQPQSYGSYQQNSVNSYQQQQANSGVSVQNSNSVTGGSNVNSGVSSSSSTQNIPVGGSNSNNSANSNSNTGYLSSGYQSQQSAYQSQSVYGSTGLSNNTGFTGSTSTSSSQYSNFSTSAKLKDTSTAPSTSHFDSVTSSNSAVSSSGTAVSSVSSVTSSAASATNSMSSPSLGGLTNQTKVTNSSSANNNIAVVNANANNSVSSSSTSSNNATSAAAAAAAAAASNKNSSSGAGGGAGGMVPNIQMVSQYIQTGLPYYQQPVYSYEDIQMMQQRVPHVQGYYDLNYTPTSLGTGRDNLGSVAYSTMTDGRFARTDNNSSPVSNVSSTMSQQAGSAGGPMLNVPYAYFYGGNMMPGSFQYGTPAIYPQQIPAANTASGGQFPKPSYNTGYSSTSYDTLSQASQDYTKGAYPSSVNQQSKSQNVTNPPQAGTGSDITSSMYSKGHVALNKVNSYEKQNFHSGTPPPFNMPNTQTAGGTSAQPYGMYLPMPAAGHHNMIHQPIHQMDGRIHNSSRRDSNSTGQRQQTSSQSKSATKQGYSPSYWTGQN